MKSNPAGISWLLTAGYKIYFSENISAALEAEYLTLTETMYSYVNGEKGNKLSDSPEVISITLGLGYSF